MFIANEVTTNKYNGSPLVKNVYVLRELNYYL